MPVVMVVRVLSWGWETTVPRELKVGVREIIIHVHVGKHSLKLTENGKFVIKNPYAGMGNSSKIQLKTYFVTRVARSTSLTSRVGRPPDILPGD